MDRHGTADIQEKPFKVIGEFGSRMVTGTAKDMSEQIPATIRMIQRQGSSLSTMEK
jgi:hypothetical protein